MPPHEKKPSFHRACEKCGGERIASAQKCAAPAGARSWWEPFPALRLRSLRSLASRWANLCPRLRRSDPFTQKRERTGTAVDCSPPSRRHRPRSSHFGSLRLPRIGHADLGLIFLCRDTISAELEGVRVHSLNEPLLVGAGASSTDSEYNKIARGMGELDGYRVVI